MHPTFKQSSLSSMADLMELCQVVLVLALSIHVLERDRYRGCDCSLTPLAGSCVICTFAAAGAGCVSACVVIWLTAQVCQLVVPNYPVKILQYCHGLPLNSSAFEAVQEYP